MGVDPYRKAVRFPNDRAAGIRGLGIHGVLKRNRAPAPSLAGERAGGCLLRLVLRVKAEMRAGARRITVPANVGLAADGRVVDAASGDARGGTAGR